MADEAIEAIEKMRTTSKETRALLKKAMRGEIIAGKFRVSDVARRLVGSGFKHSHGDPRDAWRGVRAYVARKDDRLAGGISITNDPTVTETRAWKTTDRQSKRTQQLNSYYGRSRAFILRWLNAGTKARYAGGRNRRKNGVTYVIANKGVKKASFRGKVKGKGWFTTTATIEIEKAAERVGKRAIDICLSRFANDNTTEVQQK